MKMSEWARMEIQIATSRSEHDYVKAIYNSAAKAFISLTNDGHSGMSIGMTKDVLNRLIDCKPLTELTGEDDEWSDIGSFENCEKGISFQNKRCSSVFKSVSADGVITYSDVDRFICEDINSGSRYHTGVERFISDKFPVIEMPYYPPSKPIVIYCEDFLVDHRNGDYDHKGFLYAMTPLGEKIYLDVYLKEVDGELTKITKDEYMMDRQNRLLEIEHSDVKEIQKQIDKLPSKKDISDGHHTFGELYYHRMRLWSVVCNTYKDVAWKSWKHHDDTMFDDYFIVGVSLPNGDYSYHYHKEFWDEFDVKELEKAPVYDGHKPEDVDKLNILVK